MDVYEISDAAALAETVQASRAQSDSANIAGDIVADHVESLPSVLIPLGDLDFEQGSPVGSHSLEFSASIVALVLALCCSFYNMHF